MAITLPLIMEKYAVHQEFPFYIAMIIPKINKNEMNKLIARASIKKMSLSLEKRAEELYSFKAKLIKRSAYGYIITRSDKVWFFVGRSDTVDTFDKIIKNLYPLIVFPIIYVHDFIDILNEYVRYYNLTVIQLVLRKKIAKETTKKWLKRDYRDVIDEIMKIIKKENTVLDSMRLLVKSKYTEEFMEVNITRKGLLTIYSGVPRLFVDFENLIIEQFLVKAIEERKKLREVKRYIDKRTGEARAKVISITFPNKVSSEAFAKFIEALSKTHYLSIYGKGNPYLYLVAIDKSNGSSYEVFATSKMARIIPRTKTEVDSLYLILEAFSEITSLSKIDFEE